MGLVLLLLKYVPTLLCCYPLEQRFCGSLYKEKDAHSHNVVFSPVAAGQVITRLQLTWLGRPGTIAETTGAFWILFYISVAYWVIYFLLGFGIGDIEEEITKTTLVALVLRDVLFYAHLAFSVCVIYNLRKYIRNKYAIPEHEQCPTGCEDACCSICCPCLAVAQMLRHTTDYDTYHSSCCSETGVPDNVPSIM